MARGIQGLSLFMIFCLLAQSASLPQKNIRYAPRFNTQALSLPELSFESPRIILSEQPKKTFYGLRVLAGMPPLPLFHVTAAHELSRNARISLLIATVFGFLLQINIVDKLKTKGYRKLAKAVKGFSLLTDLALILYVFDFFAWAPTVPSYLWFSLIVQALGIYELGRIVPHLRWSETKTPAPAIISSNSGVLGRRLLMGMFAAFAFWTAPQKSMPRHHAPMQNVSPRAPVLPPFKTAIPPGIARENSGLYFAKSFSGQESKSILWQQAIRLTLTALDGKDIRNFRIRVRAAKADAVTIFTAQREKGTSWITDRDGTQKVASTSMQDAVIYVSVDDIKAYLRRFHFPSVPFMENTALNEMTIEVNYAPHPAGKSFLTTNVQATLEAYTSIKNPVEIRSAA